MESFVAFETEAVVRNQHASDSRYEQLAAISSHFVTMSRKKTQGCRVPEDFERKSSIDHERRSPSLLTGRTFHHFVLDNLAFPCGLNLIKMLAQTHSQQQDDYPQ